MAIDVGEHLTEIDKAGLIQAILFSHDFAKAFWGIETINVRFSQMTPDEIKDNIWTEFPLWKWHLQQMVLEEHPIKYLEKFL